MILFMPIKQQISENTQIADCLIALLHSCASVKQGNLPVSSYASSCDKERQNKLVSCIEVHTLHPSLLPDINPAQNILAVIIPYVEWHNVWSIISTSAFWRIAAPSSSGKQIERKMIQQSLTYYLFTESKAMKTSENTAYMFELQAIPNSQLSK